ncbi:MAG TPA: LacI family DNA-binding transcriptional regulator [Armatimonadota bacterium]|nr:LacI family DNA-binding transcriptional regulator [Armatimonadota bacterium]
MHKQKHNAQKSATLDDIATRAGVSRMAVSVVLNGSRSGTRVSQATRQQILDIARELDYRPNFVARSLARRSTHIFGFYSGFDYFDARNPFIAEMTAGLLEECARHKRDLLLHTVFRGQVISGLYDELLSGKVDGLVIWATDDDPLVALLRDSRLPVVSIVETLHPFPSVGVAEYRGAFEIGQYLFERGHRSILYLTQSAPSKSRRLRLEGIQQAAAQMGMELQVTVDLPGAGGQEALSRPPGLRPTAIACWNDMAAYQALSYCRRSHIAVPQEIAITGFDGIESPIELDVRLTTARAPWAQVASTAIAYLVDLLEGREVPTEMILPVELIHGDTA